MLLYKLCAICAELGKTIDEGSDGFFLVGWQGMTKEVAALVQAVVKTEGKVIFCADDDGFVHYGFAVLKCYAQCRPCMAFLSRSRVGLPQLPLPRKAEADGFTLLDVEGHADAVGFLLVVAARGLGELRTGAYVSANSIDNGTSVDGLIRHRHFPTIPSFYGQCASGGFMAKGWLEQGACLSGIANHGSGGCKKARELFAVGSSGVVIFHVVIFMVP